MPQDDRIGEEACSRILGGLDDLARGGGPAAWLAELIAARLAREEGRDEDAAVRLKRAVEQFRAQSRQLGGASEALSMLVSREVRILEEARRSRGRRSSSLDEVDPAALARLIDLGKRLASQDDPDQVLRVLLHDAIELTGTERGFVVIVRDGEIDFALAENLDWSEIEQPSFEVSRTLVRSVVAHAEPLLLSVPETDAAAAPNRSLAEIGVRSVACVPIVHGGSALGVLYLDGRDPSHSFDAGMEKLLSMFASQAGAALENARAHRARALALEAAEETLRRHRLEHEERAAYGDLEGSSEQMQEVYRKLDRMVPTEIPVLILGETGTGKELAARILHGRGPRAAQEFVAVNCAGIAESILETELFGHERGAFTGAERSRPGLFEQAHRGTLFLDEVGDMSLRMQAELLRALQSGEVRRVGGRETIHVDVRVIAATHRNLEDRMRLGEFRQDLYYRLNVLTLHLPPLRERPDDVPLLVDHLLRRLGRGGGPVRVSERAMRRLAAHAWPGNVRELQNVVRRLLVLATEEIEEKHLPAEIFGPSRPHGRAGSLRRAEDDAVRKALRAASGNKAEAARILGVDRKTLYAKLRRLGPGSRDLA